MRRPDSSVIATLRLRAELLAATRAFFAARGVLEVETPALSSAGATDPALQSIEARVESLGGARHFLHTSPEHAMKRLLAAGSGDIYQLCRVFRDHELGRWHQPEFTMLEWYRTGRTELELVDEVETLIRELLGPYRQIGQTVRKPYADAFVYALGWDPREGVASLRAALRAQGIDAPPGLTLDEAADLALSTAVIPAFGDAALVLIHDYPASQAALARIKAADPPVAARFEAFFAGVELANGFHELADAAEQQERFERDNALRRQRGLDPVPIDDALIAALAKGLPDCAGVALGFDRLVALAANSDGIAGALAFPHNSG